MTRVLRETERLVSLSTPTGEQEQTEQAVSLCVELLGGGVKAQRLASATDGCAPDLLVTARGAGRRRLLLLGHLDTVFSHREYQPPRREGARLYGSGTIDMKGGVALALAVFRMCVADLTPRFGELSLLLLCDEERRGGPFAHAQRFAGYDACLCFEAGVLSPGGDEGVIVRRKGAAIMRVAAHGRAAHSGSRPQDGRSALLALARAAIAVAALSDPDGDTHLTVVPTVINSGRAYNVVPADGELVVDLRSDDTREFERVLAAVPGAIDGAVLEPALGRVWPAMDSRVAAAPLLAAAARRLGRPIVGRPRGGASDASQLAPLIPVTIDGLGPRGEGAHTADEHLDVDSLERRLAVAFAVAQAALLS